MFRLFLLIPCWESQRLIPKRSAGPRATKIGVVSLKALDHHRPNREESAILPLNHPPPDGRRSSVGWTYPRRGAANGLRSIIKKLPAGTSMGRLTLNMLLSFAQFEREIAGERIRDKIAASKKKGMWMGGNVPLGYGVKDRKLIINEPEAATVRLIFRRYAELGSVALLKAELDRLGIVSKRREGAGGRRAGGQHFSRGALYLMLQNRLYRGDIVHQGEAYPGQPLA